jgi:hypothetical protein
MYKNENLSLKKSNTVIKGKRIGATIGIVLGFIHGILPLIPAIKVGDFSPLFFFWPIILVFWLVVGAVIGSIGGKFWHILIFRFLYLLIIVILMYFAIIYFV